MRERRSRRRLRRSTLVNCAFIASVSRNKLLLHRLKCMHLWTHYCRIYCCCCCCSNQLSLWCVVLILIIEVYRPSIEEFSNARLFFPCKTNSWQMSGEWIFSSLFHNWIVHKYANCPFNQPIVPWWCFAKRFPMTTSSKHMNSPLQHTTTSHII